MFPNLFSYLAQRAMDLVTRGGDRADLPGMMPCLVNHPNLYQGISGEVLRTAIIELQHSLAEQGHVVGQTGCFDLQTEAAVREFQQQKALNVDGKVGALTWSALLYSSLSLDRPTSPKVLRDTKILQIILHREGFLKEVNGVFDKKTEKAIRRFQRFQGLVPDGQCGPRTWSVLLGQRTSPASDDEVRLQVLEYLDWFFLEQMLIVVCIALGMHVNPLNQDEEISLIKSLIRVC